jgi:DNA-binding NarL/FixJ family response regulator
VNGDRTATRPVRVLLVDAQPLRRAGLRRALADAVDLALVGETADEARVGELVRRLLPDVVVVAAGTPRWDPLVALAGANDSRPSARPLLLTDEEAPGPVLAALRAGACGVLPTDLPPGELVAAIRILSGGRGVVLPPGVLALLLAQLPEPARPRSID